MIDVIVPDWPAPSRVRALQTTRSGGHGMGAYAGFNLADHVGDDPVAVAANRQRLRSALAATPRWLKQVHGTVCVDAANALHGAEADASFCRDAAVACVVMTADCLPVLLCDRAGTVVAAVHAGWRGLAAGVIEATVAAMAVPPEELMAWLGPAIGPDAFEVGGEVRDVFLQDDEAAAAAFRPHGGKWLCDLYALARLRLARLGATQVHGGGFCTHGEPMRFFSYRRDGTTGRMATLIWLEP